MDSGRRIDFYYLDTSQGKPIQVSLVQVTFLQEVKWSPEQLQPTLNRYVTLTKAHWDSKIIIWLKMVPLPLGNAADYISQLDSEAKKHGVSLITGIPAKKEGTDSYYNAVIVIGANTAVYLKHHLVPFGEYTPVPTLLKPVMRFFNIPMSNLVGSPGIPKPLVVDDIKIATFICYEIAYPELIVSRDDDLGMLLTVSNDAWFGHSIASAQHLAIAQMRSGNRASLAFVSNTGITAIIKQWYDTISCAADKSFVLTDFVQPTNGKQYGRNVDDLLF